MNCHYCKQTCVTLTQGSAYKCDPCKVQYYHHYVNLYCQFNQKEYIFQLRYEHTDFPARIIQKEIGRDYPLNVLLELPKIPENINPTNVLEKTKLYLLFS